MGRTCKHCGSSDIIEYKDGETFAIYFCECCWKYVFFWKTRLGRHGEFYLDEGQTLENVERDVSPNFKKDVEGD